MALVLSWVIVGLQAVVLLAVVLKDREIRRTLDFHYQWLNKQHERLRTLEEGRSDVHEV